MWDDTVTNGEKVKHNKTGGASDSTAASQLISSIRWIGRMAFSRVS